MMDDKSKLLKLPAFAIMRRFAPGLLVLLSAVVAVGAYMQAFSYPFMMDDGNHIVLNKKLAGLQLTELWRLFIEPYNSFNEFLPLRELSFWFDMMLFGLNPSAFRLHNIFLYLLCLPLVYVTTLGVWRYFRQADADSAPWAAAAVTALFALHPALVESVIYISGRKYVLPNLFAMLALWLAVSAKREQDLSVFYVVAALAAFVAVMLSKTSYVSVAPVIAILWMMYWIDLPVQRRRFSQLLGPLAILALAFFLLRIFIVESGLREHFSFSIDEVQRALAILGWLARLSVSPESRHLFYPLFEDPNFFAMVTLGGAVFTAGSACIVMLLRKRSLEGFAAVTFLLLCMPYLQLIPYPPPSLAQDRFLALAIWPIMMLIVAIFWRFKPLPRTVILLAIALLFGFQTIERTRDWRSFEALVETDVHAYPSYYMPAVYKIVGVQLPQGLRREAIQTADSIIYPELRDVMIRMVRADQAIFAGQPREAMNLLWQLELDLKHYPVQAHLNTPLYYAWGKGMIRLQIEWEKLAKHFPDDALVRYYAGLRFLDAKSGGAVDNLRAAVESQQLPESVRGTAFKNYGFALMDSGHLAEAEIPLLTALEQSPPDFRAYCLLSVLYKLTDRVGEAVRAEAECRSRVQGEGSAQ